MQCKKSAVFTAATALLFAGLAANASASETASATISGTPQGGGITLYDISLTNTSTDGSTIGTFWFSWIPGHDFMEAKPTDIGSPAGWTANITGSNNASDGNAIQWVDGSTLLAEGGTDQFSFESTESLSQLFGPSSYGAHPPETTTFVYSGGPFSDGGFEFQVPEPASIGLIAVSSGALLFRRRRV
jgi:hypothetical protein